MTDGDETRNERAQAADDAEAMERLREEIDKLPVSDHLLFMMQSLSSLAIGRLGLTQETADRRDPQQARLAIDAFKALLDVLEQAQPGAEILGHKGMLSQLQLAYAGAVGAGAPEKPAEQPPAETTPPEEAPAKATTPEQDEEPAKPAAEKAAAPKKPAPKKAAPKKAAPKKPAAKKPTTSK